VLISIDGFVCLCFMVALSGRFFFCGALLACDGSFSLAFCFSFSNASLVVGFVVFLLLSSYACAPASRAGLKLFVVALLFPTRRLLFSS